MKRWASPNGCFWMWMGIIGFSLIVWYMVIKCAIWLFKLVF